MTVDLQPVSVVEWQAWFDAYQNNQRPLYVIKNELDQIVAWSSFSDYCSRAAYEITAKISLYIHPNMRGKGLGKHILQQMLTCAPSLGIQVIIAIIFSHNTPSLALFERMDFQT